MLNGGVAHSGAWQRPTYFDRQQLSAADLNAGLEYIRQRMRWHNRYLHGWGIVCGLRVERLSAEDLWTVRVGEGYLVTPLGDEAYVPGQTFDILPGVEACLGSRADCTDLGSGEQTSPVRIIRASIDPPGKDLRTDYNVEWVDIAVVRGTNLDGCSVQHTINPDTDREAITTYYTFDETGELAAGSVVRLHSGSQPDDVDPEPGLVHRYVAADTAKGNWLLNNQRETMQILDSAGAVLDTRHFLPGSLVPVDADVVYLVACHAETPECPRPGVPADCSPPGNTYQFSRMREGHRLEVVCERPSVYADQPTCDDLEHTAPVGTPAPCPAPVSPADNCVVLASIHVLDADAIVVDDTSDRRQLLSPCVQATYMHDRWRPAREPLPSPDRGPDPSLDPSVYDLDRGSRLPVTAVRGIGRRYAERLAEVGVRNVLQFAATPAQVVSEALDMPAVRVAGMQEHARSLMLWQ